MEQLKNVRFLIRYRNRISFSLLAIKLLLTTIYANLYLAERRLLQRKFVLKLYLWKSRPNHNKVHQTRWTGHIGKITYKRLRLPLESPGRTSSRYHQFLVCHHHHHSFDLLVRGSTDRGTSSECTRFLSANLLSFFGVHNLSGTRKLHYVSTN